jgi:hypothetical protein
MSPRIAAIWTSDARNHMEHERFRDRDGTLNLWAVGSIRFPPGSPYFLRFIVTFPDLAVARRRIARPQRATDPVLCRFCPMQRASERMSAPGDSERCRYNPVAAGRRLRLTIIAACWTPALQVEGA